MSKLKASVLSRQDSVDTPLRRLRGRKDWLLEAYVSLMLARSIALLERATCKQCVDNV